jgi:hypothetical protein
MLDVYQNDGMVIPKEPGKGVSAVMDIKLKNGVFWDVTPCGSCKNRRFGGT